MPPRLLITAAAAILAVALAWRFHALGGPYLGWPETVQDHVARERYPSRDAIVMSRRAAQVIPRGESVTIFMPSQAPHYDATLWYTAVGLMPHHTIVAATAEPPRYVITVREPLNDPRYRELAVFPEGRIYGPR
jgi:hypothetical protein